MSANNSQFIQTRKMFRDYLSGYPEHPTYDEWKNADSEDRVALLYVHFYKEITLAWYNAIVSRDIAYVTQEDGVSTVLQYLMRNAELLVDHPEIYTPNYFYKIAYNCIGCLPRTKREQAWNEVMPNEYKEDDVDVNLWDLVPSTDEDFETQELKESIWEIIRKMGPKAEKVANHLINGTDSLNKLSSSSKEYASDRLADVTVSASEYEAILNELKVALAPLMKPLFGF